MDKTFKPTIEWMSAKYAEMNSKLFRGELGKCHFNIFTTGKGSQGRTLGWFKMTRRGLEVNRYTRRMFVRFFYGEDEYINENNFYNYCSPTIELNGNYSGTEHAFLGTLVHEMCHYYTYMNGYCPRQSHGREFKEIGMLVSSRSNGEFSIQRLASAEEMAEYELNDEMKAKQERRLANKKAAISAIVVFKDNGEIRLSTTSSPNLIELIKTSEIERGNDVKVTNDANIIDFLFSKGYKKNFRTWRYWSIEAKPWIEELKSMLNGESNESQEDVDNSDKREETVIVPSRRIFSIKTSNGTFECDANNYSTLFKSVKERFPNMNDETIQKIINNPNNYRMEESKHNIKNIVESVLNEFMKKEFKEDESIEINPNMNLGLYSPLETN